MPRGIPKSGTRKPRKVQPAVEEQAAPQHAQPIEPAADEAAPAAGNGAPMEMEARPVTAEEFAASLGMTPEEITAAIQRQNEAASEESGDPDGDLDDIGDITDRTFGHAVHRPIHDASPDHGQSVHATQAEMWGRSQSLAAPPPRPGMRQRWIATEAFREDNSQNVAEKMRRGWEPRPIDSVPDWFRATNTAKSPMGPGQVIKVKEMILCEMPEERGQQRDAFFRQKAETQMAAIDREQESQARPGNPIIRNRRFSTSTRAPDAAPD